MSRWDVPGSTGQAFTGLAMASVASAVRPALGGGSLHWVVVLHWVMGSGALTTSVLLLG